MATISENKKEGKTVSYRFVVCLGRDSQKKQIRRIMTWKPPANMSPTKARKAAEREADAWEQEIREAYQQEQAASQKGQAYAQHRDIYIGRASFNPEHSLRRSQLTHR